MYWKIFPNWRNAYIRFAPDAEFPAIHGEKGITTFDLVQNSTSEDQDEPDYELISFESGQRYNMVPIMHKLEYL